VIEYGLSTSEKANRACRRTGLIAHVAVGLDPSGHSRRSATKAILDVVNQGDVAAEV
jgi:hypothetical protein